MNHRAYSTIQIKALEDRPDGKRIFRGIASTPTPDRMGDIVEPKGAVFALPIALLWQHDAKQPIGWVTKAKVTDKGIEVEGEVADVAEEGTLRNRLTEAWQSMKAGLVRGLSIGFNALEAMPIKGTGSYRFLKWAWLELSAVTIPANQEASITAIKSIDRMQRAVTGEPPPGAAPPGPGASGHHHQAASSGLFHARSQKGTTMKTIADLRAERTEKMARMTELTELRSAEQRQFTEDEGAEFDGLLVETKGLLDDIRDAEMHALKASSARAVDGTTAKAAASSRQSGPTIIVRKSDPEDAFAGQSFTRGVIAKALARLHDTTPAAVAEARWGKSHPKLVQIIKAGEVPGGGTGAGEWGSELVSTAQRYIGDFVEYLYSMTVFDKLPMRSVPANVSIKGQDGAAIGYWVGESKAIPATSMSFNAVDLRPLKVAATAVISNELIEDSDPSAEQLVRDGLAEASAQRVDTTFLSAAAAVPGISPAGILAGLTPLTSAGTDATGLRADVTALLAGFIAAKNVRGLAMISRPELALQIGMMRSSLGMREFEGVGINGGTLEGFQFYTGDNVGAGDLILLKPSDIWKIGDSGVRVSLTNVGAIEQSSAPTGATDTPVAASQALTSMFQEDSTAIKVVRRINFQLRRPDAVQFVGNAAYVASGV